MIGILPLTTTLLPILGGSTQPTKSPTGTTTTTSGGSMVGMVGAITSVTSLVGKILDGKVISKTIGQALKDGFNCWGATWTPSRAEEELPTWISKVAELFKSSLNVQRSGLENSINTFFRTFWGKVASDYDAKKTLENWIGWRYDSAKDCTLKGLIVLEKGIDAYLTELESTTKQICNEVNCDVTISKKTITLYRTEAGGKAVKVPYTKSVPQIKVTVRPDVVETVKETLGGTVGSSSGATTSTKTTSNPFGGANPFGTTTSKTSDTKTLQVMGGIGLGLAALVGLFMKTGNSYSKSKSRKLYR
ncbi:hypothetical protein [Flagellimonas aequoris]|uniref:Uncharacterized protein n=1 Tax=Flagellimonas aequoris TaxID=2306997 RepID=A0A418N4C0_9FLAO|nr:hypothetical protein [Allomuricauda aequoris]RIV68714.1 hypothetical protein D2U88_16120 [Allomuricauda aequoris]TXK00413.1 hypothetical protein FQ019_15940 [Allomuricauda aequoris]